MFRQNYRKKTSLLVTTGAQHPHPVPTYTSCIDLNPISVYLTYKNKIINNIRYIQYERLI